MAISIIVLIYSTRRDKTGNGRFYERMIPIADTLYDVYIDEIRKEGLIP